MEYIFVFKNGCWWLKIDTTAKLFDYFEKVDSKWAEGFWSLINSKEFNKFGQRHADELAIAMGMYGSNRNMTNFDAAMNFRHDVLINMYTAVIEHGEIYVGSRGGYHFKTPNDSYEQFCRRKEFVFPDFKENDIRVKQFPMGTHWYAYVGSVELRDGDRVKWDTRDEAYNFAKRYISRA